MAADDDRISSPRRSPEDDNGGDKPTVEVEKGWLGGKIRVTNVAPWVWVVLGICALAAWVIHRVIELAESISQG